MKIVVFFWIVFLQPLYKLNYLIKILYNSSIICHTEALLFGERQFLLSFVFLCMRVSKSPHLQKTPTYDGSP